MKTFFMLWLLAALPAWALQLYGDYDRALQEARTNGKYLVVLLCEPQQPQTARFIRTLRSPAVRKWLETDAVTVIAVTAWQRYPVELLYTTQLPALFVLTHEEVRLFGPLDADNFFEKAVKPLRQQHLDDL